MPFEGGVLDGAFMPDPHIWAVGKTAERFVDPGRGETKRGLGGDHAQPTRRRLPLSF
jgi:hypothetical protein